MKTRSNYEAGYFYLFPQLEHPFFTFFATNVVACSCIFCFIIVGFSAFKSSFILDCI